MYLPTAAGFNAAAIRHIVSRITVARLPPRRIRYNEPPAVDGAAIVSRRTCLALALITISAPAFGQEPAAAPFPAWFSVMPPIVAIGLAFALRQVIPAIFAGVWIGAWALNGLTLLGSWQGLLQSFEVYVVGALDDSDRAAIILFTFMIGGMVGIVSRNGGMQGIVEAIVPAMHNRRRTQFGTAGLGLAIFFDDYANTLVVGNTMRPVTDRMRISREKLAYLVDSTAAPVVCIALVTTWIGYQVSLIDASIDELPGIDNAYFVFLNSLAYSFYPVLALVFVALVATTGRDFGPMYEAERRATDDGVAATPGYLGGSGDMADAAAKPGIPNRAINALVPIVVVVTAVVVGMFVTGSGPGHETLRDVIGNADSYRALLWASLLGVLVAALMTLGQRLLTLEETVSAWFAGVRSMFFGMIVLVLSFALQDVTKQMGTADYLVLMLGDHLPAVLVPALVFVLAGVTAFGTGTAWGTMGILVPLVIPLSWAIGGGDAAVLYSSIACILTGAVWGDHCSPISDTTVLSSTASGCQHMEHVRTQMPYALLVGGVSLTVGTLGTSLGLPWWLAYLGGAALLGIAIVAFGRRIRGHRPATPGSPG